jgi:hypothetical protein
VLDDASRKDIPGLHTSTGNPTNLQITGTTSLPGVKVVKPGAVDDKTGEFPKKELKESKTEVVEKDIENSTEELSKTPHSKKQPALVLKASLAARIIIWTILIVFPILFISNSPLH